MDSAVTRGSFCAKRNFNDLQTTGHRNPESVDEEKDFVPAKKKLKTKLVDLFNRASICLMSPEDRMNVYLRVKPYTRDEDQSEKCIEVEAEGNAVVATAPESSHSFRTMKRGLTKSSHKFTFSKIFGEDTSQQEFFNQTMLDMTKDFISGQNSLVFSYGVTSSGKTYTIQGNPDQAGILPRCLDVIFNSISGKQMDDNSLKPHMFTDVIKLSPEEMLTEKKIKQKTLGMSGDDDTTVMTLLGDDMESTVLSETTCSTGNGEDPLLEVENREREDLKVDVEDQGKIRFSVWVSFAEIYNEQVYDLLEPMAKKKSARRQALKISDDRNGSPYVKGLKEIHVESADEAYRLLVIGQRNLQTASTRLNHCSSRSHCIFNIKIVRVADVDDPHIARVSMLTLCDLAGSERYSKTQANSERLKEAGNINTSLMTLSRCIETLRHNQLNRDQQKMVPFRESKLTRMLQNFFNGSGKAAMIVNVSQCAAMFDDTLHVFKFSAIAKQVKYIEKPPPPKPVATSKPAKKTKELPASQRPSIAWETKEMAEDDKTDIDVIIEDEEEPGEASDQTNELKAYIKTLQANNKRLGEMVMEEIQNANATEARVREEVTKAMMKQVVEIEKTYSAILKETSEDSQETSDERVQAVIDVYEKRIKRIQQKVDEEDEWVSSLLFHQEEMKVKEGNSKIVELEEGLSKSSKKVADLEKLLSESSQKTSNLEEQLREASKKNANLEEQLREASEKNAANTKEDDDDDEISLGNSMLVETLTKRLQDATDAAKEKEHKMEELESFITECGETYKANQEEIKALTEAAILLKKKIHEEEEMRKEMVEKFDALKEEFDSSAAACSDLQKRLDEKNEEITRKEDEFSQKLKSKDSTILSLGEECKELQEEIEKLQDQISVAGGDQSHQDLFDSSSIVEIINAEDIKEQDQSDVEPVQENEVSKNEKNSELENSVEILKASMKEQENVLEKCRLELTSAQNENLQLISTEKLMKEKICDLEKSLESLSNEEGEYKSRLESVQMEVEDLNAKVVEISKERDSLTALLDVKDKEKGEQNNEIELLKEEIDAKRKLITEMSTGIEKKNEPKVFEKSISDIVNKIERKSTCDMKETSDEEMIEDADDDEIVFKPKTPAKSGLEAENQDLAVKLKESEFANTALRSKLKREEEDFFKREQALIHGYTAEIENLKLESVKYKCKLEALDKTKSNKKKMDGQNCSFKEPGSESESDSANSMNSLEDHSKFLLVENELKSMQAQYVSLNSAYKQLQMLSSRFKKSRFSIIPGKENVNNATNLFIQDVILGHSKKGLNNTSVFSPEENITDSVLQFENEEFGIKVEEMMMRQSQQNQELRDSEEALKKEKSARQEAEGKLKELMIIKEKTESEFKSIQELKETLEMTAGQKNEAEREKKTLEEQLQKISEQHVVDQEALKLAIEETEVLKMDKEALDRDICQLKSEKNRLQSVLEESEEKIQSLTNDKKKLNLKVSSLTDNVGKIKEEKKVACRVQEDTLQQREQSEKVLEERGKELKSCKEKLRVLEEEHKTLKFMHDCDKAALQSVSSEKLECQKQLEQVVKQLDSKENLITEKEARLKSQVEKLKEKENKEESISKTVSTLEEQITKLNKDLQMKEEEIENYKKKLQEESAEFSQKLLGLEKEKRTTERKLNEVREREKELEEKCEERMKQLEQRLCEEHQMSEEKSKRLEMEDMKGELTKREAEIEHLSVEAKKSKGYLRNIADLESKLQQEQDKNKESTFSLKKLVSDMETMKTELFEFEDTMGQQEQIIQTQDEDIRRINFDFDTAKKEVEKMKATVTEKESSVEKLQSQISKLTADISSLQHEKSRRSEVKTTLLDKKERESEEKLEKITLESEEKINKMSVEFKEKLEKVICEKYDLEEKVNTLEKEKEVLQQEKEEVKTTLLDKKEKESEEKLRKMSLESEERLKKMNSEKCDLEEKVNRLEKDKQKLQEEVDNSLKKIEKEKWEVEKLEERVKVADQRRHEMDDEIHRLKTKQKCLEEDIEASNKKRLEAIEAKKEVDSELKQLLKLEKQEYDGMTKLKEQLDEEKAESMKLKIELTAEVQSKEKELEKIKISLDEKSESVQNLEKVLQNQERKNQRNREEMENWKKERDSCVKQLEELIRQRQQENKALKEEIDNLKKDNAELVKNANNSTCAKDSVIADLKKNNNMLTRELATVQGMSPPPKMDTPDSGYPNRLDIKDEVDQNEYVEIDATPPVAAKKCRKRLNSSKLAVSSSVDPEKVFTGTPRKSLKPIEERNENISSPSTPLSPTSPSKISGRMAKLASDYLGGMSPLTRSANKKKVEAQPVETTPSQSIDDNQKENDLSTRRSSRLRTRTKKK